MNDELDRAKSVIGATSAMHTIGRAAEMANLSSRLYPIGGVANFLDRHSEIFSRSKELSSIGQVVRGLQIPSLEIARTLGTITDLTSVLGKTFLMQDSALGRIIDSTAEFRIGWNLTGPKAIRDFVNFNSELYQLISSGRIDLEEAVSSFEGALASSDINDLPQELSSNNLSSEAEGEVVRALLNGGSLKGVSSAGLKFFIVFMILLKWSMETMNQGFELQKNFSEHFTKVETPTEARAQARHMPEGVNKEELNGFRVLTGDNVYLREGPGQKFMAFEKLPIGSLLQVLGSSERPWILVSVVVDGDLLEGWVLRRYTKRIR